VSASSIRGWWGVATSATIRQTMQLCFWITLRARWLTLRRVASGTVAPPVKVRETADPGHSGEVGHLLRAHERPDSGVAHATVLASTGAVTTCA
jgi:hypothetical protein